MSQKFPLMRKATAVWLIENTALTFVQIAEFCGLHEIEIQGIADGDIAAGVSGQDPVISLQLTRNEIARCEKNPSAKLNLNQHEYGNLAIDKGRKSKYTPIARRQDKPDAIAFILKYHPSMDDKEIQRLIGTTKKTISSIRDKSYWNYRNLNPRDVVLLGLCTQMHFNEAVIRTKAKENEKLGVEKSDFSSIAQEESENFSDNKKDYDNAE